MNDIVIQIEKNSNGTFNYDEMIKSCGLYEVEGWPNCRILVYADYKKPIFFGDGRIEVICKEWFFDKTFIKVSGKIEVKFS